MKMFSRLTAAWRRHPALGWSVLWWSLFLVLWSGGVTGSSLGWFKTAPGSAGIMELVGERKLLGVYRGIRGDEFIAHGTPNALAQYHHEPRFPRINHRLGLAGRNHLALHDSGAPVRHPAVLGRPAVWGFFGCDLRRALSWYWLFPIFFAVWSMFGLFRSLWPQDSPALHFLLAMGAMLAPISAAWSFWPSGYAGGLALGAALMVRALRGKIPLKFALLAGIAAGWAAAVSALHLYYPGVWPLAVLMLVVVAAVAWRERSALAERRYAVILTAVTAGLTLGSLLWLWYDGAGAAVSLIAASVYPGQRRLTGGDLPLWALGRGWLAPLTEYKSDYSNQSELQNAMTLFLPLAVLAIRDRELRRNFLFAALGGFVLFVLCYQYVGFPPFLARLTGFDRVFAPRCGMALNLAGFLLLGLLAHLRRPPLFSRRGAAVAALLLTAIFIGAGWFLVPAEFWAGVRPWHPAWRLTAMILLAAGAYGLSGFLLFRNGRTAAAYFAAVNLLAGLIFNPVCLAPTRIDNRLGDLDGRIVFATGNDFAAVMAYLAGNRVLNGYFMYLDTEIQRQLFDQLEHPERFHRMNHLEFALVPGAGRELTAQVTHCDRIRVTLDPERFDFRTLPAEFLISPAGFRPELARNPALKFLRPVAELDCWRILER